MDLKEYEHLKFELAEVLREASQRDAQRGGDPPEHWRELLARLAEDRFNVVVAGRFSQGKSTLMNALLGMDRLPTGLVPITSVLTTVRYGTQERVLLEYQGNRLRSEVPLGDLALYVSERGNPGNAKQIRRAEVYLPAEVLRRGFYFVDTPGLGSAILANTETTERFAPEIDVLVLVTSYESPLTGEEVRFLHQASPFARAVFVVVNKQDLVPVGSRQEVLEYAEGVLREVVGDGTRRPFSVSSRDGLAAKQSGDEEALRASGLPAFEEELVRFLTTEKAELFLASLCDRIHAAVTASEKPEVAELAAKVQCLRERIQAAGSSGMPREALPAAPTYRAAGRTSPAPHTAAPCRICEAVHKATFDFLAHYQHELSTRKETQERHAEDGGFCPLHTWHYGQIASPRGICTSYPALLSRVAGSLRALSAGLSRGEPLPATLLSPRCPVCEVRRKTEDQTAASLAASAEKPELREHLPLSALCLPHLRLVLRFTSDEAACRYLLEWEAALLERTEEDLLRYAIRHDALKRHLVSEEEKRAPTQALQMLVGHRNVNAVFTIEEIGG